MHNLSQFVMTFFVFSFAFIARGRAAAPTVGELTCARAIAFVEREHRYYVDSFDGPLPIYPIMPLSGFKSCGFHEVVTSHIVRTRDQDRCLVGYSCRASFAKEQEENP